MGPSSLARTVGRAASGAAADRARVTAPTFVRGPGDLFPGAQAAVTIDPGGAIACSISILGPEHARTQVFRYAIRWPLFRLSWRVSRYAPAGRWQLRLSCRPSRRRRVLTVSRTAIVASGQRAARGGLVDGAMHLTPLARRQVPHRPACDPLNPFPCFQCTYWAYEKRRDIYDQSVSDGAPSEGWNAESWAAYAKEYGDFPEGHLAERGAIAVFAPGYLSGPVGHLGYVETVATDGSFEVSEMDLHGDGRDPNVYYQSRIRPDPSYITFIYGGPAGNGPPPPAPPPATQRLYPFMGPGCAGGAGMSASGQWWLIGDGDYAGSPCDGHTEWTWTGGDAQISYLEPTDPNLVPGDRVMVWLWVPTHDAGAYAVRYDYWGVENTGADVWLGWPGYDVDQNPLGGEWYQEGSGGTGWFTLPEPRDGGRYTNILVTEHDDIARDRPDRELGAGDVSVAIQSG